MAKWKNALLISTIVAPIAFGASPLGDALAAPKKADVENTPVVLHKQLTSEDDTTQYWGNGHTDMSTNPFTQGEATKSKWKSAGAGYTFTAYQIPDKVQTGTDDDDEPIMSKLIKFTKDDNGNSKPVVAGVAIDAGNLQVNGKDLLWSDVIDVVAQPAASTAHDASNDNKNYVIQYSLVVDGTYQAQFAAWAANQAKNPSASKIVSSVSDTTNDDGLVQFDTSLTTATNLEDGSAAGHAKSLANGNWVILETGVPGTSGVTDGGKQQGMVLSLPMMDAYSIQNDTTDGKITDKYWFGEAGTYNSTAYDKNVLNLYPKDIAQTADVNVLKTDSKSGDKLAGFEYTVFKGAASAQATIQAAITAGLAATPAKTVQQILDGLDGVLILDSDETDENGVTKEFSLDPTTQLASGESYYIVESGVPTVTDPEDTHYLLDATIQPIVFDDTTSNTDLSANSHVAFKGAQWDVNNYKPGVDKSITIGDATANEDFGTGTKNGGDDTYGVDRGEEFLWNVVTDLSVDASDYSEKYVINDTLPYQTNWLSASVDVAGIAGLFSMTHKMPTSSNGGLTGHGVSYGNQGGNATASYTGDGYALPTGWTNADGLTLTANYAALTGDFKTAVNAALTAANLTLDDAGLTTWLNTHLDITGTSSAYKFVKDNRLAEKISDGNLNISLDVDARTLFSKLASLQGTEADRVIDIALTAKTNSAAQASSTIKNEVDFDVQNKYDSSTDKDTVTTFDGGWEIVKTDGNNEPLKGAGFDLAVEIPNGSDKDDQVTRAALLKNFFHGEITQGDYAAEGAHIYDADLATESAGDKTFGQLWEDMFVDAATSSQFQAAKYSGLDTYGMTADQLRDAIAAEGSTILYGTAAGANETNSLYKLLVSMMTSTDWDSNGQNVLFFMHKDAKTGAFMPEMDMGSTGVVMGDVIWTPVRAWATTHKTGDDGYLQYCGLAAGKYALIEKYAPEGYALMDTPTVTLGTMSFQHADELNLDETNSGIINGVTNIPNPASPQPTDDIQVKNYQKSMFPLVGGLGTLFAVIAGLLAMGLALLKRKKDMKNEA